MQREEVVFPICQYGRGYTRQTGLGGTGIANQTVLPCKSCENFLFFDHCFTLLPAGESETPSIR